MELTYERPQSVNSQQGDWKECEHFVLPEMNDNSNERTFQGQVNYGNQLQKSKARRDNYLVGLNNIRFKTKVYGTENTASSAQYHSVRSVTVLKNRNNNLSLDRTLTRSDGTSVERGSIDGDSLKKVDHPIFKIEKVDRTVSAEKRQ